MKKLWLALPVLFASTALVHTAAAQTHSGTQAKVTGICNDGSNWTGANKQGACSGHKGVKTWYGPGNGTPAEQTPQQKAAGNSNGAANVKPVGPAFNNTPSPTAKEQASGAGQKNQVWVNTATNVYHCPGDRFFGKTKEGKFMNENDAKKAGAKPDHGNACFNK